MKRRGIRLLRRRIHFVDGKYKRLSRGAQAARQLLIERRETSLAVHDQNEQRRLFDGNLRLAKDFLRDESLFVGNDSAGVDDFQRLAAPFGFAVDAVARDAGLVGDDGAARAGQTIEERGLAHIGAPDKDRKSTRLNSS